jgi:hypothetical protein
MVVIIQTVVLWVVTPCFSPFFYCESFYDAYSICTLKMNASDMTFCSLMDCYQCWDEPAAPIFKSKSDVENGGANIGRGRTGNGALSEPIGVKETVQVKREFGRRQT